MKQFLKTLVKIRKELERIFKIPLIKIENIKLKQQLLKEQMEHNQDNDMKDFYENNYNNQVEKNIKQGKELNNLKELHQITVKDLQQAQMMLRGDFKCKEK